MAPPPSSSTSSGENPLPDTSMIWRRVLTYLITVLLVALLWFAADNMPSKDLLKLTHICMLLLLAVWTFYFAGATAADVTSILANLHLNLHAPKSFPTFRPAESTAVVTAPAVTPNQQPVEPAPAVTASPVDLPIKPGSNPLAGTPFNGH